MVEISTIIDKTTINYIKKKKKQWYFLILIRFLILQAKAPKT
jgi:hypothetical protein